MGVEAADRQSHQSTDGAQTIVLSGAGHGSWWDQASGGLVAAVPGIVVAILVTYLTHRYATKRDLIRIRFDQRAANLKSKAERNEAIREESNKRRIDAMEKLAQNTVGMMQTLTKWSVAAHNATVTDSEFDDHSSHQIALAMFTLYFAHNLRTEWMPFELAYFFACGKILEIKQEALGVRGASDEAARVAASARRTAAMTEYNTAYKDALTKRNVLLSRIHVLMRDLTPHPG